MNGNTGNRGDLILKQTMSADQDRDEWRAGPVVAAVTGLLLLACCALPSLLCCGLPLIATVVSTASASGRANPSNKKPAGRSDQRVS